ncbi:MAG: HK97 gp10 family phage protein [Phycisphaeraceae bacterium]|nr:HK97 gp10 family phage protein [Phycisphaeraceae bacterium]
MDKRGLKEIEKALKSLPSAVARKHVRASLRKGAIIIKDRAEELASRGKGFRREEGPLADKIIIKSTRRRDGGEEIAVGTTDEIWYAHFIEFGTSPHFQKKLKRLHPGTEGNPFLRKTVDQTRTQVANAITTELLKRVQREARKAAKMATA